MLLYSSGMHDLDVAAWNIGEKMMVLEGVALFH